MTRKTIVLEKYPMAMNEGHLTEIQHYVPRAYLKRFSKHNKKSYLSYCFDKYSGKSFLVNTEDIGCERWFYEIPSEPRNAVENELQKIDGEFDKPYSHLVDCKDPRCLATTELESLAEFIATQDLRTKEHRELIRDSTRMMKEWLYRQGLCEESGRLWDEIKKYEASEEDTIREIQIDGLRKNVQAIKSILLSKKWVIYENQTKVPFWTSDNPVTRYNQMRDSPTGGNLGFACEGLEVYLPLSSDLTLVLTDPKLYKAFYCQECRYMDNMKLMDENYITFLNSLQVYGSTRQLYSIENKFDLAIQMIHDNPSLASVDKKRVKSD